MGKSTIATILLIASGLMGLAPSVAMSEPQSALNIADNDSVYVDGKSFQVMPGKTQGDATAQIKSLSARELGPGATIIRSGNKLYIADGQNQAAAPAPYYAYDPRAVQPVLSGGGSSGYNANAATNYAYDPRAVQPTLSGGGSAGYNANAATNYAYDPRAIQPTLSGGGSAGYNANAATNYAYDPRAVQPTLSGGGSAGYNANAATNYAYDPRAVQPTLSGGGSAGYNANAATNYAYDPRAVQPVLSGGGSPGYNANAATNYAYDPRAVQPTLSGGGSAGYNANAATNYAYDPRAIQPSLSGGGSAGYNQMAGTTNYAYDPRAVRPSLSGGGSAGYNANAATNYAYDPQANPVRNPNPWASNYAYDPRAAVGQPGRIKIQYETPKNPDLQEVYGRLKDRQFLETIQRILSPLRLPEELTVKTAECGMMNAWYKRENSAPTVTVCYELLKHISQSLPKQTTPSGITPTDAAIGQAVWLVLHEVGHATFDMFNVPIFGHEEDAADNFADYIMLQFGKDQARRLIGGAAWAWRGYVADYRTNPVIQEQLAGFASNHGQPQERFYNLMCLAYGADPGTFADLTQDGFLPPSRSPNCGYEYKTLTGAFHQEISPHIDQEMARRVLDTSWLPAPQPMSTAQK